MNIRILTLIILCLFKGVRSTKDYKLRINQLFDDYVNSLDRPEDIRNKLCFKGSLKYIYERLFKADPHSNQYRSKCCLDTADIQTLDSIWDTFTDLCYRNAQLPTILSFCVLTGLDPNTISAWTTGQARNATNTHMLSAKRWKAECEAALYDLDSIKSIFLLKSNYGYVEAAQPTLPVRDITTPQLTADELEQFIAENPPELPDY